MSTGFARTAAILAAIILGALVPQAHALSGAIRWLIMTMLFLVFLQTRFSRGSLRPSHLRLLTANIALAFAAWGAGWLIGGPLTDGPGWEWIFFINIPIGIVALVATRFLIPETRDITVRRSFDPAGALTVAGGLALLVYAVVDAPDAGWGCCVGGFTPPTGAVADKSAKFGKGIDIV